MRGGYRPHLPQQLSWPPLPLRGDAVEGRIIIAESLTQDSCTIQMYVYACAFVIGVVGVPRGHNETCMHAPSHALLQPRVTCNERWLFVKLSLSVMQ